MNKFESYNNSESSRLVMVNHQRKRISEEITKAERQSKFELTFFEELYEENRLWLLDKGYLIKPHGGPQNYKFNTIDWSTKP